MSQGMTVPGQSSMWHQRFANTGGRLANVFILLIIITFAQDEGMYDKGDPCMKYNCWCGHKLQVLNVTIVPAYSIYNDVRCDAKPGCRKSASRRATQGAHI